MNANPSDGRNEPTQIFPTPWAASGRHAAQGNRSLLVIVIAAGLAAVIP